MKKDEKSMGEEQFSNPPSHECLASKQCSVIGAMRDRIIELEKRAATDPLTELWNRACFDRMLPIETNRSLRLGMPLSMIFFDVDHFKNINDRHGHAAGDDVLRALAQLAVKLMRNTDILCRWGGEEFIVLSPATNTAGAAGLAEKLRAAVAEHTFPFIDGPLTITAGVSGWQPPESAAQWFARVDALMYEGKQAGRNCVCAMP